MAFRSPTFQPLLKRPLGNHEIFLRDCHNKQNGAMNQICGLTLVTRHQIDEGMKNFYFYTFLPICFEYENEKVSRVSTNVCTSICKILPC